MVVLVEEMESYADVTSVRPNHVVRASEDYFPEEEADVPEIWKVRMCWLMGVHLVAL